MTAYREVFVSVVEDEETGAETEVYAFHCNICDRTLNDGPCPDHAPLHVPGLRPFECDVTPAHLGWVVDAEDYGVPCPWCLLTAEMAHAAELEIRRDWHSRWRGWAVARRVAAWAYAAGVVAGYGVGTCQQPGHSWCLRSARWSGRRPYVLFWPAWKWRCLLRFRHWPGDQIIMGYCGKCLPCPACGSRTYGHEPGCADNQAVSGCPAV